MGIQSTKTVSREWAIERIKKVTELKEDSNYFALDKISFETYVSIEDFASLHPSPLIDSIETWTNKMLDEWLDKPYFRESIFDNYCVINEGDPLKHLSMGG